MPYDLTSYAIPVFVLCVMASAIALAELVRRMAEPDEWECLTHVTERVADAD